MRAFQRPQQLLAFWERRFSRVHAPDTLIQTGACAVELPDTRRRRCWWGRGRGVCPLPLCRVCMCVGDMMHSPDCKHTLSGVYREREEAISQARDPYADHPAWLRRNYLRKLRTRRQPVARNLPRDNDRSYH